jgi:hypothetical protein
MEEIVKKVRTTGYAVVQCLAPQLSTEEVALKLGSIMDVSTIVPGVPKIQTLRPRKPSSELMNQYSGTYGVGEFALHSDLAHWYVPPRYFLLRCKIGATNVETTLLSYSAIASTVGEHTLRRALVIPRRKSKRQTICPLPVMFRYERVWGMRWDFLFLSPLNDAAMETSNMLSSHNWHEKGLVAVKLIDPADTLVIDNWKMLHGRSSVPEASMEREIQRAYLNRLGKS